MTYAFDSENDIDCHRIRQGIGPSISPAWQPEWKATKRSHQT